MKQIGRLTISLLMLIMLFFLGQAKAETMYSEGAIWVELLFKQAQSDTVKDSNKGVSLRKNKVGYRRSVEPYIAVPKGFEKQPDLPSNETDYYWQNDIIPTASYLSLDLEEGGSAQHTRSGFDAASVRPREVSNSSSPSPSPTQGSDQSESTADSSKASEAGRSSDEAGTSIVPLNILVTGANGYIGSHVTIELLDAGHNVIGLDNLSNSHKSSLTQVEALTSKSVIQNEADITDRDSLERVFAMNKIDAVVHCAGLKAVGESQEQGERYHNVNVKGTRNLLDIMEKFGVKKIVFSSSATVYGRQKEMPIKETAVLPEKADSNYGQNKIDIEKMLMAKNQADNQWRVFILRYFNPIGAHQSGDVGESPKGRANNLLPAILEVVAGKRAHLDIYTGYSTASGTGERDYIHISDLARGHLRAIEQMQKTKGVHIYNLGTGQPYSVIEVVSSFEMVTGVKIVTRNKGPRSGDVDSCYADPSKANKELNWTAKYSLTDMIRDLWNWYQKHPDGYDSDHDSDTTDS